MDIAKFTSPTYKKRDLRDQFIYGTKSKKKPREDDSNDNLR